MKTILIIISLISICIGIFLFAAVIVIIIEKRIKNRTKSKLFWDVTDLTDSDLIDEIEKK
jgi:hypothetical protein